MMMEMMIKNMLMVIILIIVKIKMNKDKKVEQPVFTSAVDIT